MSSLGRYVITAILAFVLGATVMLLVWQSCGGGVWRGGVEIHKAILVAPNRLELTVASCNGNPRAYHVYRVGEPVRLRVVSSSTPLKGGGDCQDLVEVSLRDPLPNQIIIDDHTGRAVSVEVLASP